jgi:hypothetical protein
MWQANCRSQHTMLTSWLCALLLVLMHVVCVPAGGMVFGKRAQGGPGPTAAAAAADGRGPSPGRQLGGRSGGQQQQQHQGGRQVGVVVWVLHG